ncbi:VWA domain-containing protein [Streptomyces chattanoogensis]|uniref:von Willebrand factor A n=1 Tax=Streptomyces chattanoogensis TaxID=66876 RepID=A0A0N1JYG8_9ACTN|nr:VWA domain-containing protein [Streptomyces chattanoogensis]KPC64065.1 von Willebrand factor A [Streptomyces chattanoogensis]
MSPLSLEKVQQSAPPLVSLYKEAGVSLRKHGLQGQRATVYLVMDRSGSMRPYYKDGTMQHLAEQVLAVSAHLDDDGVVPLVFFSTDVDGVHEIGLDNHAGRIAALHEQLGHMGRTHYEAGMDAVLDHYLASDAAVPALVIFQTDGGPTSRRAAEKWLCKAAELPLFWQFIGFGDPDDRDFEFLHRLDELPVPSRRIVDNAGFFAAGTDPRSLCDADLYDRLLGEFPAWLAAAGHRGILPL